MTSLSRVKLSRHFPTIKGTDTSVKETAEWIHYLPHHAVNRHNKDNTNVRVVYNVSVRCGGPSLNDWLHTCSKFHQQIFDLLLRFRTHLVTHAADVRKAFLMIQIAEVDQDILRLLWIGDITKEQHELWNFDLPELSSKSHQVPSCYTWQFNTTSSTSKLSLP